METIENVDIFTIPSNSVDKVNMWFVLSIVMILFLKMPYRTFINPSKLKQENGRWGKNWFENSI